MKSSIQRNKNKKKKRVTFKDDSFFYILKTNFKIIIFSLLIFLTIIIFFSYINNNIFPEINIIKSLLNFINQIIIKLRILISNPSVSIGLNKSTSQ
jgi:heme/copper-type cytochrome/quinol oxidase subunit 4